MIGSDSDNIYYTLDCVNTTLLTFQATKLVLRVPEKPLQPSLMFVGKVRVLQSSKMLLA